MNGHRFVSPGVHGLRLLGSGVIEGVREEGGSLVHLGGRGAIKVPCILPRAGIFRRGTLRR